MGNERPVKPVETFCAEEAKVLALAVVPYCSDGGAVLDAAEGAHPLDTDALVLLAAAVATLGPDEYLMLSMYLRARLFLDSFGHDEIKFGIYSHNMGSLTPSSNRETTDVTYDSGSRVFEPNALVNFFSCLYVACPSACFIPST